MVKKATKTKTTNKIVEGLKEAVAYAATEKTPYQKTADRVMAAVRELNAALQEAHESAEMRVFLAARPRSSERAMQFDPQIYQMTHSTMTFVVKFAHDDKKGQWRHVKDAAFEDAAGNGLDALRKAT